MPSGGQLCQLILVRLGGKWGNIDMTGRFVIDSQFSEAHRFLKGENLTII